MIHLIEKLKKGYRQAKILLKLFLEYNQSSSTSLHIFGQSINTLLLIKIEPLNQGDDVASYSINAATS